MAKENTSVKHLVHENITSFLEDAKSDNRLVYALSYLAAIGATGYHLNVMGIDSDTLEALRKSAHSFGILNENGVVTPHVQQDLQDYFLAGNNKFILNNKDSERGKEIESAFICLKKWLDDYKQNEPIEKQKLYNSLSPSGAVHEQMVNFIAKQGPERQLESLYYLSTLAIKGEFKKDILEVFEEKYLVNQFNNDAKELGITSGKGVVSKSIMPAIRSFFSKENKSPNVVKEILPQLEDFFKQTEKKIAEIERGNGRISI